MSGGSLLKKGLPYDAEIEYLESSGTQYIDIGRRLYINTQLYVDFQITTTGPDDNVCGVVNNNFSVFFSNSTLMCAVKLATGFSVSFRNVPLLVRHNIYLTNGQAILDNVLYNFDYSSSWYNNRTCFLFAANFDRPHGLSKIKIYHFTIKEDNDIIIDLIPVRIGTTGYMYDKVSKQLFGNSGTGAFILGADKH